MQNQKLLVAAVAAIALAIVAGCTTSVPAPVQDRAARPTLPQQPQVLQTGPIIVSPANPANPALPGNTAGSKFHVVQRGETLYGIARANNTDVNALAAWNGIAATQPLRDGQVLRLQPTLDAPGAMPATPPGAPSATLTPIPSTGSIQGQPLPSGPAPVITSVTPILTPVSPMSPIEAPLKRDPKSQRLPYSDAALAAMRQSESGVVPVMPPGAPASAPASTMSPSLGSLPPASAAPAIPAPTSSAAAPISPIEVEIKPGAGVDRDGIAWTWPTSGKVTSKFNDKAPMKGIDIAAYAGTPVVAAAAGKVIYVGKEPRGFGQMIVVSHAKETVSVYFHTDKLLVKEQQRVLIGQRLAEVGDSAGNKMHFEVRRQGRPLDPISLMPR